VCVWPERERGGRCQPNGAADIPGRAGDGKLFPSLPLNCWGSLRGILGYPLARRREALPTLSHGIGGLPVPPSSTQRAVCENC